MRYRNVWIQIALFTAPVFVRAQWLNHATPGIPRTADGKPNLAARTPRAADGKPDLSGLWETDPAPREIFERYVPGALVASGDAIPSQYFLNILADFKPEEVPLRPEAAALWKKISVDYAKLSPLSHCLPAGMPLIETAPSPYRILQTPAMTAMLYERDTTFRQIYTDGRKSLVDPQPSWLGYAVGKWEGDALVVETVGFNDRGWLDTRGHTHSDALHLTERFQRLDFGHMEVQLTIDDPKTFTRPFTLKLKQHLLPDTDLLEDFCAENEKDLAHYDRK
jgi:hypothetical protein